MNSHFRTQGIVLQKEDIGEADRVFTVFTKEYGKLRLRAISERKITSKLRGGLELFYYSEIGFVQGKAYKTITDSAAIARFPNLRADIMRMRIMSRLAEIADDIVKGEEQDERVWSLFQETLLAFNRCNEHALRGNLIAYYFLWNLLHIAGYAPSLQSIAAQDARIAGTVQMFLEKDAAGLQEFSLSGTQERLLKQISRQHLSKVLET
jgi:DNA repair protein RecO (recombination protein O)